MATLLDYILVPTIVLSSLFLGLLAYTKNRKDLKNIFFMFLAISVSMWIFAAFFSDQGRTIEAQLFLSKLSYLLSFWACLFSVMFAYSFLAPKINKLVLIANGIIGGLVSFIIVGTGLVVSSITPEGTSFTINLGSGAVILWSSVILLISQLIYYPIRYYKKADALKKNQIKFVFLGFIIFALLVFVFNFVVKTVTGSDDYYKYGNYSALILVGFTSYALVRHKLMDIRLVVARSVTYATLLVILAGFYAAAILAAQSFIFPSAHYSTGYVFLQIILAIIMAFSFQPLRRWITRITDKIFFKNAYDPEVFLDTMSHTIGSSIVLIELLYKALNLITSQVKITRGEIVVLTDSGKIYTSQSMGYTEAPVISEEEIKKLIKDGTVVYDDLEETSHLKHLLRRLNASVAIPLKTDNDTEGLLILGEKLSGDMYSAGDLKVFEIIAPELAVAITNAKSFEKIEKFNITLRSEVKKATAELEKKNTQLMELDKAKDEFISMASHQLRTPLTAIKGYLSMLLEGDAGEIRVSQYDFVNEAFNGANRMVGLINDLLNVSRMETGRFFLEPVEIDLDKLISEEVKQLEQHAKEKHLALKYVKKGKIPHIWADETKIRQVVMNFIDNAVYYTTKGSVTVKLHADDHDVVFEVVDTGIGVPKAQQKQLFTKFYRADNARHVRPDGTGLGIYLAKRVLDDHHANLIFESKEGKGSTFGFKFPIKSKLSIKKVTAPVPQSGNGSPAIGELAAGIGVSAEALSATSSAGLEKPLSDSTDAANLSKEAVKMSKAAATAKPEAKTDIVTDAQEAVATIKEAEIKREEENSKK